MRLDVRGILVRDLDAIYRQRGCREQVRVLNAGADCPVLGVTAGRPGLAHLLDAAAAVSVARPVGDAAPSGDPSTRTDALFVANEVMEYGNDLGTLELPDEGTALCILVADRNGPLAPLAILCGSTLPVVGGTPPCTLQDLRATWTRLVWGDVVEGRFLLEQLSMEWDAALERQLTERLRALYGE